MTVEKTQKRLSAIRKHLVIAFLGLALGAFAAGYYSPARPMAAAYAELHIQIMLFDYVQRPLGQPAPPRTLQLVAYFQDSSHYIAGQKEFKKMLWHTAGGGIAGALAGLVLMTFIAHPSLILRFFKTGVDK